MNHQTVKILLDKYFEGETNLQEEAQLNHYFQQENIPDDLLAYRPLFRFYSQEKNIRTSDEFDQKIKQATVVKPIRKMPRIYRVLGRVAAVLILSVLTYQSYELWQSRQTESNYTVLNDEEDIEEAYKKVKEALLLVSSKMDAGTQKAASGLTKINETTQIINKE